jgi:hypothetical protein
MAHGSDAVGDLFIDIDEWREFPRPHRYVHGGFAGTRTLACFRVGSHRDGAAGTKPYPRNNARVRVVVRES